MTVSGTFIALALIFYCFGTSCPHNVGIIEIGIAISLLISVLFTLFKQIMNNVSISASKFEFLVILSIVWLLFFPIIPEIFYANKNITLWEIARDILPFMFFIIPIFFISMGEKDTKNITKIIPIFTVLVGVVYSIRFISYIHNNYGSILSFLISQNAMFTSDQIGRSSHLTSDSLCLPFDPAVFFSAFYLSLSGLYLTTKSKGWALLQGISLLILAILPIAALAMISSRIAFALLALLLIIHITKFISKHNIFIICALLGIGLSLLWPVISLIYDLLIAKQVAVGLNNKFNEVKHVYDALANAGFIYIIAGLGWGAEFYDPAVGSVASFTHSLISYFFLKSGVIGVVLLIIYMWWVINMLLSVLKIHIVEHGIAAYSISAIIVISLFFQPIYKTPTYGILLLYALSIFKMQRFAIQKTIFS